MSYTTDDMKNVNIGISSFSSLIEDGLVYVDKSKYGYDLLKAESARFFFIARPRRFGKSLFVSMLEAALMGKREMFEGLYLGSSDYDFHPYPVIHLDMSKPTATDGVDVFRKSLTLHIAEAVSEYGLDLSKYMFSPSDLFMGAIKELNAKTGERVAILIDEYDYVLTSTLDKKDGNEIREVTKEFYGKLKPCADKIRFLFITGITRFSNQSIFSKLNNLVDLTFSKEFAAAFGYTQSEMEAYFEEGLAEYIKDHEGTGRDDLIDSLRYWYDGYRFSDNEEKVYNPISINSFFRSDEKAFESYWGRTASTSMVVKLARRANLAFLPNDLLSVRKSILENFSIDDFAPEADLSIKNVYGYLYMTGYLTLDHKSGDDMLLTIPNHEVEKIITEVFSTAFLGDDSSDDIKKEIEEAVLCGDIDKLGKAISEIISIPTYDMRIDAERFYQALIFSVASLSGRIEVRAEEHTARGRSDLVFIAKGRAVITELKLERSADEAISQIKERGYADKYLGKYDEVWLLGVSIAKENLQVSWKAIRL